MQFNLKYFIKIIITFLCLLLGVVATYEIWRYYLVSPWTKDGRIRATIYQVSSDVTGLVNEIYIKENQLVQKGDLLLELDKVRFEIALNTAKTNLMQAESAKQLTEKEYQRNVQSGSSVSKESLDKSFTALTKSELDVDLKNQELAIAKLNLARSQIFAPANGYVSNIELSVGSSVTVGKPIFSIIDNDSFYAQGYFEESKLSQIQVGDKAKIKLIGNRQELTGVVESIAYGIADPEFTTGASLLPSVTPNYNWIRLAQRIPVRIKLDEYPIEMKLIAGQTATIQIENTK